MKPEELAKYYAEKVERENVAKAEQLAAADAEQQRIAAKHRVAERAMTSAITYLENARTALRNELELAVERTDRKEVVGIELVLRNAYAEIKLSPSGEIHVSTRTRVYNGEYGLISKPEDFTEAKLGELIKILIDG